MFLLINFIGMNVGKYYVKCSNANYLTITTLSMDTTVLFKNLIKINALFKGIRMYLKPT